MTSTETNKIDLLQRSPSDLRRYLEYIHNVNKSHGSVLSFIQHERLRWSSDTPSGNPPFTDTSDYRILFNDWPYGIDSDIVHLVVWTKFHLEDDAATGDLTWKTRAEVEAFVDKTFCDVANAGPDKERVIWFKNWRSLKSVHALEHFHVMLYRADKEFLQKITDGDQSVSEKMKDTVA